MKITKQDRNVTHLVSNENVYYITRHSCPKCSCVLFTCSCPSFQMGIARKGGNPFVDGCKHIQFYKKEMEGQTFDIGPQKQPASVEQVEGQIKQTRMQMSDEHGHDGEEVLG